MRPHKRPTKLSQHTTTHIGHHANHNDNPYQEDGPGYQRASMKQPHTSSLWHYSSCVCPSSHLCPSFLSLSGCKKIAPPDPELAASNLTSKSQRSFTKKSCGESMDTHSSINYKKIGNKTIKKTRNTFALRSLQDRPSTESWPIYMHE